MRLYCKLVLLLTVTWGVQAMLPHLAERCRNALFLVRCAELHYTQDPALLEALVQQEYQFQRPFADHGVATRRAVERSWMTVRDRHAERGAEILRYAALCSG
jgi:hypothetical protein